MCVCWAVKALRRASIRSAASRLGKASLCFLTQLYILGGGEKAGSVLSQQLTGLVLDVLAQDPDHLAMDSRETAVERFGTNVRDARRACGWTQEELAERSGMASVQISRVERGVREVRLTSLLRIARALRTTPNRLLEDLY